MLSIGLDVHQNSTAVCQLDANGKVARERVIRGGFAAVAADLALIKEPFKVCFEASCGYGTLHDLLAPAAREVVVAHPGRLKLIFATKHKNDRSDAKKIAKLLYMDEVPVVHVPAVPMRAWRGLIEHRARLVDKRTRAKNALRAMLRTLGIKSPARRSLWSKPGLEWLEQQALPTPLDRIKRDSLLAELRMFDQQVSGVERELNTIGEKDWRVILLRSMPGVGPRTAEALAAYIDRPERFVTTKAIGKYFGVIPCQDQSAGKNRLGHITKEGPATVRKLITQAAWQAVRRSPGMKAFFEQVSGGRKHRKAVALIAAGHKMLRIALAILKSREPWKEEMLPRPEGAVLPASASADGIETPEPRRRGRGKDSSGAASRAA